MLRQAALTSWFKILEGREGASRVGRQISKAADFEEKMLILVDTFADKSTATLRARAYYFSKFLDWLVQGGEDGLYLSESQVYNYCRFLRQSCAAPTSASRLKETIVFAKAVLGWAVEPDVLAESTCKWSGCGYDEGNGACETCSPSSS